LIKTIIRILFSIPYRTSYLVDKLVHISGRHKFIKVLIQRRLLVKYNIDVSYDAQIGYNLFFPHPFCIVIGKNVIIGDNVKIYQGVTLGQNRGYYPRIGDNVIIYAGAKIIGQIDVGMNAVIGANAVVTKNVKDNEIVAGIPATVIGTRKDFDGFY
jgi:serine O-acetyltransferase